MKRQILEDAFTMSFKVERKLHDDLFAVAALRQLNEGKQVSVSFLIREALEELVEKELR